MRLKVYDWMTELKWCAVMRLYTSLLYTKAGQTYWLTVRLHNDPVCFWFLRKYILTVVSSLFSSALFNRHGHYLMCIQTSVDMRWPTRAIMSQHGLGAQRKAMMGQRGVLSNLREGHIWEFVHLQLTLLSIAAA